MIKMGFSSSEFVKPAAFKDLTAPITRKLLQVSWVSVIATPGGGSTLITDLVCNQLQNDFKIIQIRCEDISVHSPNALLRLISKKLFNYLVNDAGQKPTKKDLARILMEMQIAYTVGDKFLLNELIRSLIELITPSHNGLLLFIKDLHYLAAQLDDEMLNILHSLRKSPLGITLLISSYLPLSFSSISPQRMRHAVDIIEEVYLPKFSPEQMAVALQGASHKYKLTVDKRAIDKAVADSHGHFQFGKISLYSKPEDYSSLINAHCAEILSYYTPEIIEVLSKPNKTISTRYSFLAEIGLIDPKSHLLSLPPLTDFIVRMDKTLVEGLTSKEQRLFSKLQDKLGQVLTREEITQECWPYNLYLNDWDIDQLVYRLRKKLAAQTDFTILTKKGEGFMLVRNDYH